MDINIKIKQIIDRMYKHRIDQYNDKYHKRYTFYKANEIYFGNYGQSPSKMEVFLKERLEAGDKITSGYYTTSVRGFHEYYILIKNKKDI